MLVIGLMSGTSMDGIDASLIETNGTPDLNRSITSIELSYPQEFKTLLKAVEFAIRSEGLKAINKQNYDQNAIINAASKNFQQYLEVYLREELNIVGFSVKIQKLSNYLAGTLTLEKIIEHSCYLHTKAVQMLLDKANFKSNDIDLIGYHGQTFFHQAKYKISIILGSGQMLADLCKIKVINDFRRNDIENGGQGAPLVPIYHQALTIRDNILPCSVINCGGVANITLIKSTNPLDLIGFDTGPGNGLIDRFVRMKTQGAETLDLDGQYGLKGKINDEIVKLLEESLKKDGINYFDLPPPKSLDVNDFKLPAQIIDLSLEDGCATLEAFTASSIVHAIKTNYQNYILAGGGWYNPVIKQELTTKLKQKFGEDIKINTADEIRWSTKFLESQTFAYLAARSFLGLPLSFPCTTGVHKAVSGGKLHHPRE